LEHLSLSDFRKAVRETSRILKPDGIFRLAVPDLEHLARHYISDESPNAAIEFMKATLLGKEKRNRSLVSFLREWF
jgi:predicted SAM-dependent methyltransferase